MHCCTTHPQNLAHSAAPHQLATCSGAVVPRRHLPAATSPKVAFLQLCQAWQHEGDTLQQRKHHQHHQQQQQQQQHHQQQHQQHHQQQQQAQGKGLKLVQLLQSHLGPSRPPPHHSDTLTLQRKLTAVLRDCTCSSSDVADVLFVAESCGCLNAVHVAAALTRLVRLDRAQQAAAGAGVGDAVDERTGYMLQQQQPVLSAVVGASRPFQQQMRRVRQAALQAASHNGGSSRWHIGPVAAADADAAEVILPTTGWEDDDIASQDHEQQQVQHLVEQLAAAAEDLWPSMSATSITSITWALAHLQHQPSAALLQQAGAALAAMASSLTAQQPQLQQQLEELQQQQGWRRAQQPKDAAQAQAQAGQQHQQQLQQQRFALWADTRQVMLTTWALAKITPDLQDLGGMMVPLQQQEQKQQLQEQQEQQQHNLLHHLLLCMVPHMPGLSSQHLLLLMWAAATWAKGTTGTSSSSSNSNSSSCVESPLLPLPDPAAEGLLSATESAMASQALTPRGLAVIMWAAAHLGLTPDAAWLGAWTAAMHTALPAAGPQDVSIACWGLARMGCPPPAAWLADLSRRAAAVAPSMAARELPALLWALARLRYRPPLPATHALLQQGGRLASQGALSPQGLALLLWSSGSLGLQLPGRWVDGLLAVVAGFLPLFRPREAACLWVGLVWLQHIPVEAWLEVWWAGSRALLAAEGGRELALLLWCGVQLGQAPPGPWLRDWLAAVQGRMAEGGVSGQEYGIMWAALTQLAPAGLIPSKEWLSCFFAASSQPSVMSAVGPMSMEAMLTGLAAVSSQLQEGLVLPPAWVEALLPASLKLLPTAKLVNIASMLQAAGQLALPLPPVWLAAAMVRLQQLLVREGVLPAPAHSNNNTTSSSNSDQDWGLTASAARPADSSSSSSSVRRLHGSMVLSVRIHRQLLQVRLQQVLSGLRAQQMLNPAAQRKLWQSARQLAEQACWGTAAEAAAADMAGAQEAAAGEARPQRSARGIGSSDVLAVWPWLSTAVAAAWPDARSAQQALQVLAVRD